MSKRTRFYTVPDPRERKILDQLVTEISKKFKVSTNLLEHTFDKTLQQWEDEENLPVSTIYLMRWEDRAYQIEKVVDRFKENMRNVLSSEKNVQLSSDIAMDAFKMIYYI